MIVVFCFLFLLTEYVSTIPQMSPSYWMNLNTEKFHCARASLGAKNKHKRHVVIVQKYTLEEVPWRHASLLDNVFDTKYYDTLTLPSPILNSAILYVKIWATVVLCKSSPLSPTSLNIKHNGQVYGLNYEDSAGVGAKGTWMLLIS